MIIDNKLYHYPVAVYNGRFIDLSNYGDNVFPDDNVLEVFYHDSAVELFKELDEFIARQNGGAV